MIVGPLTIIAAVYLTFGWVIGLSRIFVYWAYMNHVSTLPSPVGKLDSPRVTFYSALIVFMLMYLFFWPLLAIVRPPRGWKDGKYMEDEK